MKDAACNLHRYMGKILYRGEGWCAIPLKYIESGVILGLHWVILG